MVANYAPLNFDLCLLDIWTTLKYGGTVAMVDQDRATQGAYLADLIGDNEVNVLQAVPMLYRLLIDVNRENGRTFPSVRHAITTGDKIPASSLAELPKLFPNARFYNVYGCTETNDSLVHEFLGLAEGNVPTNVPVGQPIPGVIVRVQTEDGTALEGTGTGEFMVWTPFQTRGYLKSSLNEGKFVTLEDDGRTYYKSGDIVRRHDDGTLTLEGRADFYVKVRGVRVSTQVVEQAIQEHPAVIEVAVIAVPDELAGRATPRDRSPRGRREAQQPAASPALLDQAGPHRDALDDSDRDRSPAQNINWKGRPQGGGRRAREESCQWRMKPPRRSRRSSSRSSCRMFRSRISRTTTTC